MELFDLERKIKNNIEGSKIKQNLLEGFLNELQKIGDGKGKNSFGDRENMLESEFRKEGEIYEVDEIGDVKLKCKNLISQINFIMNY